MNIKFCSIKTGKVLENWEEADHVPDKGDALLIKEDAYSVVNKAWINKNKIIVNIEKIPRNNK